MQFINVKITTLLIKMKELHYLMFLIQSTGFASCCSVENVNNVVENAFISCSDNDWCTATCYRGYIFPTGIKEEFFSCQDGTWAPLLSSCKRVPVVFVKYLAVWKFFEILPSDCNSISIRLDILTEELEEGFANRCQDLNINATFQFRYSFLAFTVNTTFAAEYRNYTTMYELNVCINYTMQTFPNVQIIKTMFEGITCSDLNSSNTISKPLYVSNVLESCSNGTDVHYVTTSDPGKNEKYCDFRDIFTSDTTPEMTTEPTISSSLDTTIFANGVWFTENNDYFNTSKSTDYFSKDDPEVESVIYITTSAGGVLLISCIIILVVCVQKRVKSPETLPAVDNKVYDNSFKGELIENELYQSADNEIDSTCNKDNTKINMSVSSKAPYCKDLTQIEQELEQDQYSYPSKCKETNLCDEFKDEEIDKLHSNAAQRGHQQTLNFDPDSDCQYAVVRE